MQSSIFSSTLCLSLLASLAVAAPNEPTQSGASQNSGVSETQKPILLAQNTNAQTIGATQDAQNSQSSGFFSTLLGTGGGGGDSADASKINTYQLGAVEITAPQEPDINPTVTIVSKDNMNSTAARDVGEALRFTPGLFYMPSTTGGSSIYIRGFSEGENGYYFDGIPINDIYDGNAAGGTDLFPFFTFGLSEIQVSKGYVSPAFSGGKMGGAINMVSYTPRKNLEFKLNYQFVANNEHHTNAQVGRNFGDSYFNLNFTHYDRKSLNYSYDYSALGPTAIGNTYRRAYMLTGKYGWIINDNHEYSVNFYHQHQTYGSFPYKDKTAFYVLGDSRFNNFFSLNSRIWYHMDMNQSGATVGWSSIYDNYSIGLTETAKISFSENQNLKVGILLKNEHHRADDVMSSSTAQNTKRNWDVLNSSLFAEYALRANDMFRFVLSGSYDRHDSLRIQTKTYTDRRNDAPLFNDDKRHLWGYTLQGILYVQPIEPLLLHANVGHKTNIPKIRQLYNYYADTAANDSLTNESLINYELGADFNYKFVNLGTMSVGAAAYFNDINNMIITTRDTDTTKCLNPTSGYCYYYQNADAGYSYGGEFFARQGFFDDKLTLGATWSYIQRKSYNYDNNGNRTQTTEFTTHPRQNINLSVLITPRQEYDISLNGSVQTSRYARVTNTTTGEYEYVHIPTVVYFDIAANYHLTKRLKLSAGAYNLLDRNYNYSSSSTNSYTGGLPGRRVYAGFEYNYSK